MLGVTRCTLQRTAAGTQVASSLPQHRAAAWSRMDPVVKWTTLIDAGRNGWDRFICCDNSKGEQSAFSSMLTRLSNRKQRTGGGERVGDVDVTMSYPQRLKVGLSLLMWIRCLRDVQDTMARLHLPFATSKRIGKGDLAFAVFPTRLPERVVDPHSHVEVILNRAHNETGEQIAAPHTWDPATSTEEIVDESDNIVTDDTKTMRAKLQGKSNPLRSSNRESTKARLRRVHGVDIRLSEDDERAARLQTSSLRMKRKLDYLNRTKTSSAPSTEADQTGMGVRVDSTDSTYHGNANRLEGCPMNENGELQMCPIHVPTSLSKDDVVRLCVTAHASILSSLYIEGRTVAFTTDSSFLAEYVKKVFVHLVDDGYVSVTVVDGEERMGSLIPYVPSSFWTHVWLVLPMSGIQSKEDWVVAAGMLLQHGLEGDVIVPDRGAADALGMALGEQSRCMYSSDTSPRWRITVTPLTSDQDWAKVEGLSLFQSISILHKNPSCRQLAEVLTERLAPNTRLVGVNACAMDMLWYYPHASILPWKLGNAFRYRGARRSVLKRSWPKHASSVFAKLRGYSDCFSGYSAVDVKHMSYVTGVSSNSNADHALRIERKLEFLARPSKWTFLGSVFGSLFGI